VACTPAPACKAALTQATKRWPERRATSDGICASPKHHEQNPTSDHELGNAFDLSHDPEHGVDTYELADRMRRDPDPRVKYVISNGRIWNPSISPAWRPYHGENQHTHHMHVSIVLSARGLTGDWWGRYFPTVHAASTGKPAPAPAAAHQEDFMRKYVIVDIPKPRADGAQVVGVPGVLYSKTAGATIKANDDGRPVHATVQTCAYVDALLLSFVGLDGGPVPPGKVGVTLALVP
jgi:hypothetical protein